MTGPEARPEQAGTPAPDAPQAAPMDMARWGRRAASIYLVVAGLALVAMLVETVLGHAGVGTMFAAILAAPWSMLAAKFLPPLPRDWPMAAGLAIRMAPLALFMLLNAAIIAGIAARSERDLRGVASRVSLLLVLACMPFLSGCILTSRQVVLTATPVAEAEFWNTGIRTLFYTFDLSTSPEWVKHHGKLSDVTDLAFTGTFSNPLYGPAPGPWLDATIGLILEPESVWGPLRIEYPETRRIDWDQGIRLMRSGARFLRSEVMGDGRFTLAVVSEFSDPNLGGVAIEDFHLAAVLQVR